MKRSRYAVISIGNPIKRDDNIANLVLDRIRGSKELLVIKAQTSPENFIKPLKDFAPRTVFFVDAIDFGGDPGEVRLFQLGEVAELAPSTHSIPITLIKQLFRGVDIKIIGIQPKSIEYGFELSRELKDSFEDIVKEVGRLLE